MWATPDKPVNWVANRGGCTSKTALDLVERHVGCDLKELEKLLEKQESAHKFVIKREDSHNLLVSKVRAKQGNYKGEKSSKAIEVVTFHASRSCDRITVYYTPMDAFIGNRESFDVTLEWDFDKGVCGFTIGDVRVELWQISQKALYKMFFDGKS